MERLKTPLELDLKLDGYVLEWRALDRADKTPVQSVLYGDVDGNFGAGKPPAAPVTFNGMRLVKIARDAHQAASVGDYNRARDMFLLGVGPLLQGTQDEKLIDGQTDALCRLFGDKDFLRAETQWFVGIDFFSISKMELEELLKCGAIEYCPSEFGSPAYRLAMSGRNALVRWGEKVGLSQQTVDRETRENTPPRIPGGCKVMEDWEG